MVKLIIWDLDDTLWSGTLAEGDQVSLSQSRASAVRRLNRQGVVNSICSKNDFLTAKDALEQADLWDQFVFPEISFQPKGELVKRIIQEMNLRSVDVVFIDDNEMNLREVKHACPEITVLDATVDSTDAFLSDLVSSTATISKCRIPEYRILEEKRKDRQDVSGSNEEFLASCEIKMVVLERTDNLSFAHRIEELINRTNQLNYTKSRVELGSTAEYIIDNNRNFTYSCFVWDKYGYYGLVGFASVEERTRLRHFLFSCRTMNMGIESALASFVQRASRKNIVFPVHDELPSWIEIVSPDSEDFQKLIADEEANSGRELDIRIMANCQSGAISHYVNDFKVEADNWPRVFTLEDFWIDGKMPGSEAPLMVYGAFNDYDLRYWKTAPTLDRYESASKALVTHCMQKELELVVILPPTNFTLLDRKLGIVTTRFRDFNEVWKNLSESNDAVHCIEIQEIIGNDTIINDPRHFDRTTLQELGRRVDEFAQTPRIRLK